MAGFRPEVTVGWAAFRAWALCGVLWTVPWFSFGPGVVTLPFAGLLTWGLGRYAPHPRDAMGLVFGVGGLMALLGLANLNQHLEWLITGLIISSIAVVIYWMISKVDRTETTSIGQKDTDT